MSDPVAPPAVVPYLCYADPAKAIKWLVDAFGFVTLASFDDGAGNVYHAELRIGERGLIMINGPVPSLGVDDPQSLGAATVGVLVRLGANEEIDEVHTRAVAAGADVRSAPEEKPHGSYEFTCRDPQGQVWTFATYTPSMG